MFKPERAEHQLILDCARPQGYKEGHQQGAGASIKADALDWTYVLEFADRHRIAPLLHYYLNASPDIDAPAEVVQALKSHASEQALTNLFQTQELLKIMDRLKAAGVDSIPFKGPVLGQYLYNNIGLRPFGDLDILIHKNKFSRAKEVLLAHNYEPYRTFSAEEEEAFLDTRMGFEFVRKDGQSVIEVHWSFLNAVHTFNLSEEAVWKRREAFTLQGQDVAVFSPAHLLIYLCAHGSKSLWARLRWICDVAELAASRKDDADFWKTVIKLGKETRSQRMLYTGLYLAQVLLKTPLPPNIQRKIKSDIKVIRLTADVVVSLFAPANKPVQPINPVSFHLLMRERFVDRIPYYKHLFQLWSAPSTRDKDFVSLPRYLEFLYVLIKPIRMMLQRDR